MRTAETPPQTPGLKPLTMVQVFLLVVLGVDRLTKACSFCNCLSSDLQKSRKCSLAQQLDLELHTPLHPLQPGTAHSPEKRNSLPHHISCQPPQDKLTYSASATAAPSSLVHGFQLCRLPPFPGKTRGVGEKQRDFVGQQWRLHISHHLWVAGADKMVLGSTWYHLQQSPESTTSSQMWGGMKPCQSCREAAD